jgi:hypothetical protein
MDIGEIICSLCDYSQEFIKEYQNSNLEQRVIDAIVVDYLNAFALRYGIDLAMYTIDLRSGSRMSKEGTIIQKDKLLRSLNSVKMEYNSWGIIESVNRNSHMNECAGKAEASNEEALKVVEAFIDGYMKAK